MNTLPISSPRHDLRILQALRRIIHAVDLHSKALTSDHDVTGPQLVCLLALVEAGELSPTELSRRVHVSKSTVIGIVRRLEAKGLVSRRPDEDDRRVVHLTATEGGIALARKAPSPLQKALFDGLEQVSAFEAGMLARALERIVELMKVEDVSAAPLVVTGHELDP